MTRSDRSAASFARIELRARDRAQGEALVAEAYEAGAVGLEEREDAGELIWELYAPAERMGAVAAALQAAAGAGAALSLPRDVPDRDWPELWKEGLHPVVVSPHLVIRPTSASFDPAPDQVELVIDPGQAFGTGGHASTRLALEWVDALAPGLAPGARVLDIGTGSGVLALAAVGRGAATAVGFDLDPVAVAEAARNLRAHPFGTRVHLFVGPLDAVSGAFELVLANLLRREMEPLLEGVAERTAPGGAVVLSGLLEREVPRLEPLLRECGLAIQDARTRDDESAETWTALVTRRRSRRASG